jgi:Tfp pilus assembly protein PilO
MSSKMKQWVALTVVGCFAVLAAGWLLVVSPKRGEAAQVRDDVNTQVSTNSGLQTQLAMLKAQAKTLPMQQAKLALVAAKIPDNPALPALIRALSSAADDAGVELVSLSPAPPVTVETAGATGGLKRPGTAASPSASAGGSSQAQGKSKTLGHAAAGNSASQSGALTSIALTINVVGGYFQIEQFFDRLENLSRAAKVTGVTMAPGTNPVKAPSTTPAAPVDPGKVLSTNITANVYMAVGRGLAPTAALPAK